VLLPVSSMLAQLALCLSGSLNIGVGKRLPPEAEALGFLSIRNHSTR